MLNLKKEIKTAGKREFITLFGFFCATFLQKNFVPEKIAGKTKKCYFDKGEL